MGEDPGSAHPPLAWFVRRRKKILATRNPTDRDVKTWTEQAALAGPAAVDRSARPGGLQGDVVVDGVSQS